MKTLIPAFLISLLIFTACGEQKKSAKDLLYDKVMAVHDEVMPKMDDISKYKKQLKDKIAELDAAGSEVNAVKIEELKKAFEGLENSHDDMMGWMHQFDSNFDGMVEKEIMGYLNNQMKKIETVGKTTNDALKYAEQILAQ
jgi:hypothetical protein